MSTITFANGHGSNDAFDCILPFIAIFTIQVDTELIVFTFARAANAHGVGRLRIWREESAQ